MRFLTILSFPLFLFACGGGAATEANTAPTTAPEGERGASREQGLPAPAAAPEKIAAYPTEIVQNRSVEQPIRITGRVVPLQEAVVASQVPGIVLPTDKLLQEGKYYQKGETMVRIDDEQLRLGLRAERSKLVSSLVRILSDLSIDYAADYPQWETFANGIRPDQPLPEMPAINNNQLRYYVSATGIPAQYYGIKAQEALLDDYTVRAPFSGQLTMAQVDPGSYVQPGAPLARISRTDIYEMKAAIPASAAVLIRPGQQLKLRARNLNRSYDGTINRFGTAIDPTTQTVTAYVRVSGPELRSGLYLEAELPGEKISDVAVLPKEALTRDNTVYVITNGIVGKKAVDIALIESDKVYLRGLTDGDRVITQTVTEAIVGSRAK